jgi:hypothetical protein
LFVGLPNSFVILLPLDFFGVEGELFAETRALDVVYFVVAGGAQLPREFLAVVGPFGDDGATDDVETGLGLRYVLMFEVPLEADVAGVSLFVGELGGEPFAPAQEFTGVGQSVVRNSFA